MKKVFMAGHAITHEAGGMSRVVVHRANMFTESGIDAALVSFNWSAVRNEISDGLRRSGRLSEKVELINMFEFYAERMDQTRQHERSETYERWLAQAHMLKEPDCYIEDTFKSKNSARYYSRESGALYMEKKWDDEGRLVSINYFNDNLYAIKRDCFGKNGRLIRRIHFNYGNTTRRSELFFSHCGHCYLANWYSDDNKTVTKICLYDGENNAVHSFSSMKQLCIHWLRNLASHSSPSLVIADGVGFTDIALGVRQPGVSVLLAMHSNHYNSPYVSGSTVKEPALPILNGYPRTDGLVVLTEEQKRDIQTDCGEAGRVFVVPNALTPMNATDVREKVETNLVVCISRFSKLKRIDRIIHLFKKVLSRVPDARLEIYGKGEEEDALKALVSQLNLSERVHIGGYVQNIEEVYQRAAVSVTASASEGFGLSICESCSMAVPVVAFNSPYGPKMIIRDAEDGFLVNTDHEFVDRLVFLLKSPETAREMGLRAKENIQRFSEEKVRDCWLALLEQLEAQPSTPANPAFSKAPSIAQNVAISRNTALEEISI